MGATIPPESKSQLASEGEDDPHESVTIAPPAPNFEEMLRQATPVPLLVSRSDQHFRAALDAGVRAGSSLGELSKIVAELSGGLSGAKSANEQLVQELSTLRAMLGSANEQQLGLQQRLAELEQELLRSKLDAERERLFLTDQHDEFVAALLEEHEAALAEQSDRHDSATVSRDVGELAQKLRQVETLRQQAESEAARLRDALLKAQAQRDEALARADKLERERDELRAEASQLRARLGVLRTTTPPPPVVASRPPSFRPEALQLDSAELDSTLHTRSPSRTHLRPRLTPAPVELDGALFTPRPAALTPSPGALTAHPQTASPFPRESTRPGVGRPPAPEGPASKEPVSGWTPPPPAPDASTAPPPPRTISAATLPSGVPGPRPVLKPKLDPATRPLTDYSLGGEGLPSETLEGVRLSSKPPRK